MAPLRKQDVRREGEQWVVSITLEARPVKTDEACEVILHEHLFALGFPAFVEASPAGILLRPVEGGTVPGPLRRLKNRLAKFARETVTDDNVQPSHAWRHRCKMVGMKAGIPPRVLDVNAHLLANKDVMVGGIFD